VKFCGLLFLGDAQGHVECGRTATPRRAATVASNLLTTMAAIVMKKAISVSH
jgi:hypothetical protein